MSAKLPSRGLERETFDSVALASSTRSESTGRIASEEEGRRMREWKRTSTTGTSTKWLWLSQQSEGEDEGDFPLNIATPAHVSS